MMIFALLTEDDEETGNIACSILLNYKAEDNFNISLFCLNDNVQCSYCCIPHNLKCICSHYHKRNYKTVGEYQNIHFK